MSEKTKAAIEARERQTRGEPEPKKPKQSKPEEPAQEPEEKAE